MNPPVMDYYAGAHDALYESMREIRACAWLAPPKHLNRNDYRSEFEFAIAVAVDAVRVLKEQYDYASEHDRTLYTDASHPTP